MRLGKNDKKKMILCKLKKKFKMKNVDGWKLYFYKGVVEGNNWIAQNRANIDLMILIGWRVEGRLGYRNGFPID